jgi:TPR repeat protein
MTDIQSAGLSESDRDELKNSLSSQKKPLDELEKQITSFRDSMEQFKTEGISSLRTLYDQYSSIKGVPAATEKLRNRIALIESPYVPKPTPTPKPSSRSEGIQVTQTFSTQPTTDFNPQQPTSRSKQMSAEEREKFLGMSFEEKLAAQTSKAKSNQSSENQPWWVKAPEAANAMKRMYGAGSDANSPRILEFQEALTRAEQGDAYAQAVVSIYCATGYKTSKDMALASKYAMLSARQKNPLGIYRLGVMRETGEGGISPNPQEGAALKEAAFQGLNNSMVGDPYAITALGVMCFRGDGGLTKNPSQAAALYRKAADMGYAPAQYCYSACLYNGQGVQRNPVLAEQYWRLACQQQYPPALKGKPVE